MFSKSIIVGMFVVALTTIAPQLGLIGLIGGGIAVAVWQSKEEKAARTTMSDYDSVKQIIKDTAPEQHTNEKQVRDEM